MNDTGDPERRSAWRAALVAAGLNATFMPVDVLIGRDLPGMPWWPSGLSSAIGIVLCAFLLRRRRSLPSVRFCSSLFVVNALVTFIPLVVDAEHFANAGSGWEPFQANKLGVLTVALLAPEPWAGILSILGYTGTAIVQFLLFSPTVQARMPIGEPWAMLAYGGFSIGLLLYRRRSVAIEQRLMMAEAVARQARVSLAVRDLANTPIQTITLVSSLLRHEHPELAAPLDKVDRAVARLADLKKTLSDDDLGGTPKPPG